MSFEDLKNLFVEKCITLGSVESFTGGLFASEVTKVSGASKFFKGALITYATEEKIRLLGVNRDIVDECGVVSEEIAREMAIKGQDVLDVDYCVSFTGNAGPLAMEDKPVGLCFIGVANKEKCEVKKINLNGSREQIQNEAILIALDLIKSFIE